MKKKAEQLPVKKKQIKEQLHVGKDKVVFHTDSEGRYWTGF
jgi:hypothetical protein